ncbi:MAG: hypothetical protein M5U28_47325 [Sandaracinaceae bacterium]|nr:hypothetical protein [Sandaracinaceae bacterium]
MGGPAGASSAGTGSCGRASSQRSVARAHASSSLSRRSSAPVVGRTRTAARTQAGASGARGARTSVARTSSA